MLKLTGGRPMKLIENCRFVDVVSGKSVNLYKSRLDGKEFLAENKWSIFRVERSL